MASQVGFQSNEVCALEALRREHLGAVVGDDSDDVLVMVGALGG